ncbi:MAG: hypothetical protein RBT41_01615 [Clostridia bacterium]|jgi:hypothetical protein|nr:hypothetical protein [Clostridia bacterium]
MSLEEKLLVSLIPVICETFLLQEMYRALFRQRGEWRRRLTCGLLFIAVGYPIVFLTDNPEYFAHLLPVRGVLMFILYVFMLKAAFGGPFFARALPAAAAFLFIVLALETLLWTTAVWMGLAGPSNRRKIPYGNFRAVGYCRHYRLPGGIFAVHPQQHGPLPGDDPAAHGAGGAKAGTGLSETL